jgi:hypothetical protein
MPRTAKGDLAQLLSVPDGEEFEQAYGDYIDLQVARRLAFTSPAEAHPGAFKRDEAAEYLGISPRLFDAEVRDELAYKVVNSVRLYPKQVLDAWLADCEPAPKPRRRRRGQ